MKRSLAFFLSVLLLLSVLSGCAVSDNEAPFLEKPKQTGTSPNGKPQYKLHWSRVRGAGSYEIAIYTELDGYEGRSERYSYDKPEITLIFLQGVYTDTVTYRVKVRARLKGVGNYGEWSNIWMLDYKNGVCTISECSEDFDTAKAEATATSVSTTSAPKETPPPLAHSFPESLSDYIAHERGLKSFSLAEASELFVSVLHCEYGEPGQSIRDSALIAAAAECFDSIVVTGLADHMDSTGDSFGFGFYDADGSYLGGASFQDGLLLGADGRYAVDGLEALISLPGVMLFDEWDEFWEEHDTACDEYEDSYTPSFPENVFAASGYDANRLFEHADEADLYSMRLALPYNYSVSSDYITDSTLIRAVFEQLCAIRVTDQSITDSASQEWYLELNYTLPGVDYCPSAYICFYGDCFQFGNSDRRYKAEGVSELLELLDTPAGEYLREHGNERQIKPVF